MLQKVVEKHGKSQKNKKSKDIPEMGMERPHAHLWSILFFLFFLKSSYAFRQLSEALSRFSAFFEISHGFGILTDNT